MANNCEIVSFILCLPLAASFIFGIGEDVPCGKDYFNPKTQCCCRGVRHQIPKSECQCCHTEAYRRNETKPDYCTGLCGNATYHTGLQATQMCCDGHVVDLSRDPRVAENQVCCGHRLMDTTIHNYCCNGFPIDTTNTRYGCCKGRIPYHRDTMRCYTSTDSVMMKSKIKFSSKDFCDMALPEWDIALPLPSVRDNSMIHVRGIPEQCSLRVRHNSNGHQIEIRLNPFVVVGQDINPVCANSDALLLIIKLQAGQDCFSESELKARLHGVALDIFARKQVVCSKADYEMSVLRLKDGHKAVIFVSKHAQSILRKSLT